MAVKRKAIFKKAVARNLQAKKYENAKRRLTDAFRGIPKRPGGDGRIQLDPREWNGGFGEDDLFRGQPGANPNVPSGGFGPGKGRIYLDPREWNGGFDKLKQAVMPPDYQAGPGKQQFLENSHQQKGQGQEAGAMQPRPQPQPGGYRIGANAQQFRAASLSRNDFLSTNEDGSRMNQDQFTDWFYPDQYKKTGTGHSGVTDDIYLYNWNHYNNVTHNPNMIGREEPGEAARREADQREAHRNDPIQPRPQEMYQGLKPTNPGRGGIQLDPRERNGGFGDDSLYRGQPGANPNVPPGGFGPGKGMIHLDPRESGGFNRPPMKMPMMPGGSGMPGGGQRPMPMPGVKNPGMRPIPMPIMRRPKPGIGMPQQPARF